MNDPVVVGIDAGGTKTRAFVVTRAGEIVGRGAGGGANLMSSPDPQGSIAAALQTALAGRVPSAVVLSCAGGDRDSARERGRAILTGLLGGGVPVDVTHDAKAALYAGDRSGCGVVLIAGTVRARGRRPRRADRDRAARGPRARGRGAAGRAPAPLRPPASRTRGHGGVAGRRDGRVRERRDRCGHPPSRRERAGSRGNGRRGIAWPHRRSRVHGGRRLRADRRPGEPRAPRAAHDAAARRGRGRARGAGDGRRQARRAHRLGMRPTEERHPQAAGLSSLTTRQLLELMNEEDATVPKAVRAALPAIERAVEAIAGAIASGGRVRYVGAGTSGRLGVLDASEWPPTFGVDPRVGRGIIAGGDRALRESIEGAEDDPAAGERDIRAEATAGDVVIGISASGRAPYVRGALGAARALGAHTVAVTCDPSSPLASGAEVAIVVDVGPEVLAGSSRLKAGTATKLVLNMLSTAAMVRLGRTRDDLMTDLRAVNAKLKERAVRIVAAEAHVNEATARDRLERTDWDVRKAIALR
ncbi:MAG: N-acetylmuramic acid 6-phosphate etherase [Chloroflexi bacterium]|nr:N-acetylmuramic acid 6-phosphate etherase [Chloroflexota bacterium]